MIEEDVFRRFWVSVAFHDATWSYARDEIAAAMAYALPLFANHGTGEDVARVRVTETGPNSSLPIRPEVVVNVRRTFTAELETT